MPFYLIGLFVAILTAYFMTRPGVIVFFGEAHSKDRAEEHGAHGEMKPHESPWLMLFPLVVLAVWRSSAAPIELPFTMTCAPP